MNLTLEFPAHIATAYDAENPEIWEMFEFFTFQLITKGYKRIGSKMVVERIRWETMVRGTGSFKVNNNMTPYYARKFERSHPEYSGLFEKRQLKQIA
jgi:hypothetical protein